MCPGIQIKSLLRGGFVKRFQSLMLCCFFLLAGCTTDEANRYYLAEKLPEKKTSEVEVLREAPAQPHEVIGEFQANNASANFMRKRAAKIGADAVIVIPAGGWYSQGETWAGSDKYSNSYTRLIGIAIRYKK
jgi:hypothetical protein